MGVQSEEKQAMATFGTGLRTLREEAGISLNELSKKMGWSAVYQSDVERNRAHPPNTKRLNEIALHLGIHVEQLIKLVAADKRFVKLEIDPERETELSTATILANRWATLTDDQLTRIQRIVNGKDASDMTRGQGDGGLSLASRPTVDTESHALMGAVWTNKAQ